MIVFENQVDDRVAGFLRVLGQFAADVGGLHGNDRRQPRHQNGDRQKDNREQGQNRFRPAQTFLAHFCNHRIEQVSENDRDRDWDEDRLNKADHGGDEPDDRASDRDQDDDKDRRERRPHRLALPGCGVSFHAWRALTIDLARRSLADRRPCLFDLFGEQLVPGI